MHTLYALDLTRTPEAGSLWRRRGRSIGGGEPAIEPTTWFPGVPRAGFASRLGFWFANAESWATTLPSLRVEFADHPQLSRTHPRREGRSRNRATNGRAVRAQQRAPVGRSRSEAFALPVDLEVNSKLARVGVDAATWPSASDAVLLVITQFWRFQEIDRTLDELSDWARQDLERVTSFRGMIGRRRARELRARRRLLQELILDLPDFEGALTNPRGYLPAGRPVRLYHTLVSRLGLDRWRREIDERVEVVEATFDSLAESLDHHQALAFQIVLELVIVAVLLLDAGLFVLETLVRR
jgi:hypothetical protein